MNYQQIKLLIDDLRIAVAKSSAKDAFTLTRNEIWQLLIEIDGLQARIDSLMMEFCPDDMTPEQVARWESNQVVALNKGDQT